MRQFFTAWGYEDKPLNGFVIFSCNDLTVKPRNDYFRS